jgi:hypothetical protein
VAAARRKAAQDSSGGLSLPIPPPEAFGVKDAAQIAWLTPRLTPHPLSTFESPLHLAHPVGNGRPAVYVRCTDPIYPPLQASRDWVAAQGWRVLDLAAGHDAMVTSPEALAALLEAEAA